MAKMTLLCCERCGDIFEGTDGTQFGKNVRFEADVTINISGGNFENASVINALQVPGDTSAETLSAIIADEAAIGMINKKTTAVRVIPVPGKKVGETVVFGGLLGYAPIMDVNKYSSDLFVKRGGRIPAPIHSLNN